MTRSFRGHKQAISALAFHPNMKQVASSGFDSVVKIWNFKPSVRPFTYKGHKGPVLSCDFSRTGSHLVSGGKDGTVKLWPNKV